MANQVQPNGRRVFDDVYTFPQDSQDLADDIYASWNARVGTTAERQALPTGKQKPGMLWSETDTGTLYRTNGSVWTIIFAPLRPWEPTVGGLAVGNGTLLAEYTRRGDIVDVFVEYTHGSTSSVSGAVTLSLPIPMASPAISRHFGVGLLRIATSGSQYPTQGRFTGGAGFNLVIPSVAGSAVGIGQNVSNTYPTGNAWGAGAFFYFQGTYKAAA